MTQFRHGDLLLEKVNEIPAEAKLLKTKVLARGEATGHSHRVKGGKVYQLGKVMFLETEVEVPLVHEEHKTIKIPAGDYKITRQREYDPYEKTIRQVQD